MESESITINLIRMNYILGISCKIMYHQIDYILKIITKQEGASKISLKNVIKALLCEKQVKSRHSFFIIHTFHELIKDLHGCPPHTAINCHPTALGTWGASQFLRTESISCTHNVCIA